MPERLLDKKSLDLGNSSSEPLQRLGQPVIGAAILWAAWAGVHIISQGGPERKDGLPLFAYPGLGAMVGIDFQTQRLPLRYLDRYRRHGPDPGVGGRHRGPVGHAHLGADRGQPAAVPVGVGPDDRQYPVDRAGQRREAAAFAADRR